MDLRDELARLDLMIHREILRLRARYQLSLDEFRGLFISDEQVDQLVVADAPATPVVKLMADAGALADRIGDASPLGTVGRALSLDRLERDALLVALAPEIDLKYETLYAYLNNGVARGHATIDLVARLCGAGPRDAPAALQPGGRLLAEGLLELGGETDGRPLRARRLSIAPALAAVLQGLPAWDARLDEWVEPVRGGPPVALPPRSAAEIAEVGEALARAPRSPIVLLLVEPGMSARPAAEQLFRSAGRAPLLVDAAALPDGLASSALALVARLGDGGVFVDAGEEPADGARRALPRLLAQLHRAGVPVAVAAPARGDHRWLLRDLPVLRLAVAEPAAGERTSLWASALAEAGLAPSEQAVADVADHFRLGPLQIRAAAGLLAARGQAAERAALFEAARHQSSGELARLATRVPPRHCFDDLVLPPVLLRRLRDVLGAIRARAKVFGTWGFGERGGRGLMVLFAGSSGTGKTMSASVLAREIGLELHRLDLASVVSKFIGETEQNLDRIFEAARAANVILLFDEADALLGRRSEVRDAHDRYANIEVAYLLQKMEEHDGVVILSSNLPKNMDQAFARRMHYVLEFPRPDPGLREQLWRRVFPAGVPMAGDVDFAFLARQFDLAGGDIKTIALDAAFLAGSQDRAVAMTDLVGAVSRQMLKQGRPLGASDFKQYHGSLADQAG